MPIGVRHASVLMQDVEKELCISKLLHWYSSAAKLHPFLGFVLIFHAKLEWISLLEASIYAPVAELPEV